MRISDWSSDVCSSDLFVAAAAVVFGAARANPRAAWTRFVLLALAGLAAGAALVGTQPQCANGPFAALDPIVVQYWYRTVLEGQPFWAAKPHDLLHVLVPSPAGLAGEILAWRDCAESADRRNWATIIVAPVGAAANRLRGFRRA